MDIFVWLSQVTIPLFAWWVLQKQLAKLSVLFESQWKKGQNFKADFLYSVGLSALQGSPENHSEKLQKLQLPLRVQLLWLGLRSFSFALPFLVLFFIWGWAPSAVILLLGLAVFILARWAPKIETFAILLLALGVFAFGFENLMNTSSQIIRVAGDSVGIWVYSLAENYLVGALIGLGIGAFARLITKMSGVSWWLGLALLLSGILSLGAAWGFILGDFAMGLVLDLRKSADRNTKLRIFIGLGLALLFLVLTPLYQSLVMGWINGQYSVQLRHFQLAVMVFGLLAVESLVALTVFHFAYQRTRPN